MSNQNYRQIQNLLGGLTITELTDLRKQIDFRIGLATNQKGSRLIGYEHGYVEIKEFKRKGKKADLEPYKYEYWRWWDGKTLKSQYIGKVGTYAKQTKPAQPKKQAA